MAFYTVSATAASAVANAGTLTFGYPAGTGPGTFNNYTSRPAAFARGLQNLLNWPTDFTLTFGSSSITFTYGGTTSIPAGTIVDLQLETSGRNDGRQFLESTRIFGTQGAGSSLGGFTSSGIERGQLAPVLHVKIGSPAVASTTAILATTAVANGNLVTLSTAYTTDAPRCLQYVSSGAGDTSQTITIRGFDEYGVAMSETKTMNGTSPVLGLKAFKTVVSYQTSAALAGNLSIGTRNVFGLPVFLPGTGWILRELQDGASPTAGTFVAGIVIASTATAGDVRGTWAPNGTPNGTVNFEAVMLATDPNYLGVPQFSN